MSGPSRLAFDALNNLYVVNGLENPRTFDYDVTVYNSTGALIKTIMCGCIQKPSGIAVDAYGDIYIADNVTNSVVAFNHNMNLVDTFTQDENGFPFNAPGALAIHGEELYLGLGPGSGENAVISYYVGDFLTGWPYEQVVYTNSINTGPTGIAFDDSNNVYVSDCTAAHGRNIAPPEASSSQLTPATRRALPGIGKPDGFTLPTRLKITFTVTRRRAAPALRSSS